MASLRWPASGRKWAALQAASQLTRRSPSMASLRWPASGRKWAAVTGRRLSP